MKFCILDISNLAHRAKYAIGNRKLTNPNDIFGDEDVQAGDALFISGIITMMFYNIQTAITRFESEHVVAAFDERSWRHDFYPDYKGRRKDRIRTPAEEHQDDLMHQVIDIVYEYFTESTNITVLRGKPCEADDLIARWVQVHDDDQFQHVIVSADGDFKQLVRDNVELYNPISTSLTLYTMDGVYYHDTKRIKKGTQTVMRHGSLWKVKLDKEGQPLTFDPAWELFEKCIRGETGESSDNISSAYPRVHTTKMKAAFEGDIATWNNFINTTWGNKDNPKKVKDLFERNRVLIELTEQPDYVIDKMDQIILEELNRPRRRMVGAYFSQFCKKHKLDRLTSSASTYTTILKHTYD